MSYRDTSCAGVSEFELAIAERVSAAVQYLINKEKKWGRREIEIGLEHARSLVQAEDFAKLKLHLLALGRIQSESMA